jgi:hypothetical protein
MVRSKPRFAARPRQADRVVAGGIALTLAIVLAGIAAQLVNYGLDLHVAAMDSNKDGGAFGVVGDVALAAAALAAWVVLARDRAQHLAVLALPLLLTFLAVDKTLRLHDEIPGWLAYYVPVLLATFGSILLVGRELPAPSRRLIRVGLALLAISFLIHLAGPTLVDHVGLGGVAWIDQVKGAIKHGAEVAGWLFVGLALFTSGGREPVAQSRA